jgi:acyl transferase domain-containing protein/acyl-CoA synthetase (AMP-forming)/AMP-acid ligase II/acyl carrier protein
VLRKRAAEQAEQDAFVYLVDGEDQTQTLTFGELDRQARSIAAALQQRATAGDRVLLLYPPGLDFVAGFYGCLYAGMIAVPAYPPRRGRTAKRVLNMFADCTPVVALTVENAHGDMTELFSDHESLNSVLILSSDTLADASADWREPAVDGDTIAFLQYTSGSTATPKGVMVSHGNLLHNSRLIYEVTEGNDDSVMVSWLPHYHDMGLISGVVQPVYGGSKSILLSAVHFLQKPLRWLHAISTYGGTVSPAPNFAYDLCVENVTLEQRDSLSLSTWRSAVNGAEPIREGTVEAFTEFFAPSGFKPEYMMPAYGLAECTLGVTWETIGEAPKAIALDANALGNRKATLAQGDAESRTLVGSGPIHPEQEVAIIDPETYNRCGANAIGEIWVKSASAAKGYWDRPEESAETFAATIADTNDGSYMRTGDLGCIVDGQLLVTGRLKDLIIIRGVNYYPQDIELAVESSHEAFRQNCSAAFALDVDGEEHLVVAQEVERRHVRNLDADGLAATVRRTVTEQFELDVHAVLLVKPGGLPKTSSGKIQRRASRQLYLENDPCILSEVLQEAQPFAYDSSAESADAGRFDFERVTEFLIQRVADRLQVDADTLDVHQAFSSFGLNSLAVVQLAGQLEEFLGQKLSPTLVYEYPSIHALARYLSDTASGIEVERSGGHSRRTTGEPIAIVGMSCRFPGAKNLDEYWKLLSEGVDAIREVPEERWDLDDVYDPDPATPGRMHSKWGGFVDDVKGFDPGFFGIPPREAAHMDPQQRLLMEVAWESLEHAGIRPETIAGTQTGSFVGIGPGDYVPLHLLRQGEMDAYMATGNAASVAANRLSYFFDFRGPSVSMDTACSTSLVTLHHACQSLRSGESDLALAGGVSLILTPFINVALSQARMLSPNGRCATFDKDADGYVRSEGCGLVVLKRLSDALDSGDNILAVVRGSAVNHDGKSNGLTAPNTQAQQAVIRAALESAGVDPAEVTYLETHGTGTPLGDPIEITSIKSVLLEGRDKDQSCALGSVKTNIGHLETAAGIAGLIKTVLALQHGTIPPHLNHNETNPIIELDDTPLYIADEAQPWPAGAKRRIAGVSAFGFGGANAHAVLEEAPAPIASTQTDTPERPRDVLHLSARSDAALHAMAQQYAVHLNQGSEASISDICFSANTGRARLPHRLALITEPVGDADPREDLAARLAAFADGEKAKGALTGIAPKQGRPKVAFLFTGQGAQCADMAKQLYDTEPVFRATMDRCDEILRPLLDTPLLDVIYPDTDAGLLNQTAYTQPALFALEYSLAQMWKAWGIEPDYVMGHSVGELAAACVAGAYSLEEGLALMAARGKLIQSLPAGGAMAAVFADRETVEAAIARHTDRVSLATLNGPKLQVISGDSDLIDTIVEQFNSQEVRVSRMTVSHAFHSPLMDPILDPFQDVAAQFTYRPLEIPLISNADGKVMPTGSSMDAAYWRNHIRNAVQFDQGMNTLAEEGCTVFIEMGPANTLIGMGKRCVDIDDALWLSSLSKSPDDWKAVHTAVATLQVHGVEADWTAFDAPYDRARVALPSYPFERKDHWITPSKDGTSRKALESIAVDFGAGAAAGASLSEDDRERLSNWLYRVDWREMELPASAQLDGDWLVVSRDTAAADAVRAQLESAGASASTTAPDGLTVPPGVQRILHVTTDVIGVNESTTVCKDALALLQAAGAAATPPPVYWITQGAVNAGDAHSLTAPAQAALWGIGRTVSLEQPELFGGLIDCDPNQALNEQDIAQALSLGNEPMVALRGTTAHTARLTRSETANTAPLTCHADGTYLLTGGLGGLGAQVAHWLVDHGARRLLLLGRTALPARAEWADADPESKVGGYIATVRALEAKGASVHLAAIDVGDADAVAACLDTFRAEQWPAVRGVIHLAGVLQDQSIAQMEANSFDTVFGPKARGARVLHDQFADDALDFFVLFSSAASLLGSPGQANYAAANAYLDALAETRRAQSMPALSLNWGPWAEVGMAAQPDRGGRLAMKGMESIAPADGLAALGLAMTQDAAQTGVLDADWGELSLAFTGAALAPFFGDLADAAGPQAPSAAGEAILGATSDTREALVQDYLMNCMAESLQVDAATLSPEDDIVSIGLDSIMVMDVLRTIQNDLKLRLNPREVFDQDSLAALATYIATEINITQDHTIGEAPPEEGYLEASFKKSREKVTGSVTITEKNPSCVFLLSSPRAGSTLFRVMLAGHPQLFSPPELHLLPFPDMQDRLAVLGDGISLGDGLQRGLMEIQGIDADEAQAKVDQMVADRTSTLEVYRMLQDGCAPRALVDKSPSYGGSLEFLERAEEMFDNAKYLYLHRHPYSVIESYVRSRTGRMFDFGHADPFLLAEEVWTVHNSNFLKFFENVDPARMHRVCYEEMVVNPEPYMREVCAFLEVNYDDGLVNPYDGNRMTDGLRPDSRSIGDPNFQKHTAIDPSLGEKWRSLTLPRPLGEAAQTIARKLGYELPAEDAVAAPVTASSTEEFQEERL